MFRHWSTGLVSFREPSILQFPSATGIRSSYTKSHFHRSHNDPRRASLHVIEYNQPNIVLAEFRANQTYSARRRMPDSLTKRHHFPVQYKVSKSHRLQQDGSSIKLLPCESKYIEVAEGNPSRSIIQQICRFRTTRNPCVRNKIK